MRLKDADKRRNSDEKEKNAQAPLHNLATSGTCFGLLFTHKSHNKKGKKM